MYRAARWIDLKVRFRFVDGYRELEMAEAAAAKPVRRSKRATRSSANGRGRKQQGIIEPIAGPIEQLATARPAIVPLRLYIHSDKYTRQGNQILKRRADLATQLSPDTGSSIR